MLSVVHRLKIFRTKFSPMINLIHTGLLTYICLFVYVYVFSMASMFSVTQKSLKMDYS